MKRIVLIASLAFFACTRNAGAPKNILRYPLDGDPVSLDSAAMTGTDETLRARFIVLSNLMDGLTRLDRHHKILPALAERWDAVEGGKIYTFHLRDTRWSDGVPLAARDFVASWLRLLDPARKSQHASLLFPIENAREYHEGKISRPEQVGIKVISERRLLVRLKEATPHFLENLAHPAATPNREDILRANPEDFSQPAHFRSTGPYRLTEWVVSSSLTLDLNPYYYGEKPTIEKVRFFIVPSASEARAMFERGELDVAPSIDRGMTLKPYVENLSVDSLFGPRAREARINTSWRTQGQ